MSESYLAYTRSPFSNEPTLTTGISYDVAGEIDDKNGWREPGEMSSELSEAMIAVAARGLNELIMFCFNGQKLDRKGKGMRTAIRRFIAVAWMLKSDQMVDSKGKALSLDRLSKLSQVRCTRCTLSLLAQEFGRRWGFRVRVQKKESSKPNYAHAAKGGWEKRRSRSPGPASKETPTRRPPRSC